MTKENLDTMDLAVRDTDRLYAAMEAFALEFHKWEGEDMQREVAADLALHLSESHRAILAFQLLTRRSSCDTISADDKRFAVTVAEELGPDWCQWLYRFAVLCTKLA